MLHLPMTGPHLVSYAWAGFTVDYTTKEHASFIKEENFLPRNNFPQSHGSTCPSRLLTVAPAYIAVY